MDYNFSEIEKNWQKYWADNKTFAAADQSEKPKFYVLDMFPYPSGAGLHVGHPLGYIASDIYSRYKRHLGFNVLHPMGYDSFGLPAEQYAIQTGQHPKITTEENIATYRRQLDQIGFSFDWDREVRTSKPEYYKWTQWIFIQIFNSWYNKKTDKAEDIADLIAHFENKGTNDLNAHSDSEVQFTAEEWNAFSEKEKAAILMDYRLAFLADSFVNWCPALGTVLANDEIKDGVSERGGHPVERKKMQQWSMRISAYSQRLLDGLETIDWTEAIKEIQRNWIGRSQGASIQFDVANSKHKIEVFTTRPDTIFGVSFMVIAPEHELVNELTTAAQKEEIEAYVKYAASRSERERMTEVKKVSGAFTGAYAKHPFTGENIPIWIGDYVLAGYGTGAVMAVPSGDQRDWDFAKKFELAIPPVIEGQDVSEGADDRKDGILANSDFLNGLSVKDAIAKSIEVLEEKGIGKGKINFRLRDAVFSRQRYWGEPIPIYYEDGIAKAYPTEKLPLELPEVDKYLPTEDGEPPLARASNFTYEGNPIETSTMPGWAGSSWYMYRYISPNNTKAFASKEALDYWKNVDLYFGGAEHATGHLLYARFWCKFLKDRGHLNIDEPFQKLINQGMILGNSRFVYRDKASGKFISKSLRKNYETISFHVDVNHTEGVELDIEAFKTSREEYANAEFILEDGKYICGSEVEKMSKSKFNVVNPDHIVERYGADTLRLYEMFLGPLEQAKPWDMDGIEGVHRFLRKLWRLYHNGNNEFTVSDEKASKEELKSLHKTIKKIREDIERYSFNTGVSAFMICVNELSDLKCNKREILEPLAVLISPYAPHIAEELWKQLGHSGSISLVNYPAHNESFLVESSHKYPVSFNGKMRFMLELPADMSKDEIEKTVLAHEESQKWLEGKTPKKMIVIPKKIVNVVI
ncbi:MAG: leucine--tRNA ligase [Bacteroidetes bacterium]|nr:MAG: leucine--tRNA ligase [Bacteroidota bacterium]MBL1145756.1 leucine--tRNA ligase [Bacteroidota bacterium]NOG58550.1 leucine--tRNA ligase [Bacteroidota bacterium]